MDINKMTIEQLKQVPRLEKTAKCDSIILLPSKIKHNSGYNYYQVVACFNNEILGKTELYDTFSIFINGQERVGIDCLNKSGLMRIFFSPNSKIYPTMYNIEQVKE